MGRLLTVIAGLLVLALLSLALVPYVIDWQKFRPDIEAHLQSALQQPVKISGAIELALLPVPLMRLSDVAIGKAGAELRVARLETELSPSALFKGEWRASEVRLDNPRLWLSLDRRGRFIADAPASDWRNVSIERLVISEGEVTVDQEGRGTRFFANDMTVQASATSLFGPWRAEGRARFEGNDVRLSLQTGRGDADGIRARLSVVPAVRPIAFDLDALFGRIQGRPSFSGALRLSGVGANDAASRQSGWRVETNVEAGTETFVARDINVVPAGDERAIALNGVINLTLGEEMRADAALSARQIDLDRLAGASPDAPLPLVSILERLTTMPVSFTLPKSLRLRGSFDVGSLVLAAGLAQDVHALIDLRDGKWRVGELRAKLPGQTSLKANADVDPGAATRWLSGKLDVETPAPAILASWALGEFFRPQGDRSAGTGGALALSGRFLLDRTRLAAEDIRFGLPGAALAGGISVDWSEPVAKVKIDASSDDVDVAPVIGFLAPFSDRFQTVMTADAQLKLAAKRLRHEALDISDIDLSVRRSGNQLALDQVRIGSLNGLAINGEGSVVASGGGELHLRLAGDKVRPAAEALSRSLPASAVLAGLLSRAEALSPLAAKLTVKSAAGETTIALEGEAGGSTLNAGASFASANLAALRLQSVRAELANPATPRLLQQLGLWSGNALSPAPGRISLNLDTHGEAASLATLEAELAGSKALIAGRLKPGEFNTVEPGLALALSGSDINPLLLSLGLVPTRLDEEVPAALKARLAVDGSSLRLTGIEGEVGGVVTRGDLSLSLAPSPAVAGQFQLATLSIDRLLAAASGAVGATTGEAWSSQPFSPVDFGGLAGQIAINADKLEGLWFDIAKPKLTMRFVTGGLVLDEISGDAASGRLTGSVAISREAARMRFAGRVNMENAALGALAWQSNGKAVVDGKLDASLTFEGAGRSPAELIATMQGGGRLVISQGRFSALSPAAFEPVAAAAGAAGAPDLPRLVPLIQRGLESGDLAFRLAETPLTLKDGVVSSQSISVVGADITARANASVELARLTVAGDVELEGKHTGESASPPRLSVHFSGPLSAPRRRLDVRALGDYLNLRRFEGELARLEAVQRQIDEREAKLKELEEQERARRANPPPAAAVAPVPAPAPVERQRPVNARPPVPSAVQPNTRFRNLIEGTLRSLPGEANAAPAPAAPAAGSKLAPLPPPVVIPSAPPIRP